MQSEPPEPPEFSFAAEMRETRLHTDALLAEGKVEEAEAYMEERRLLMVEHGYAIRVLNQAYFAFHGAYAESPASSSPIGAQVRRFREHSDSVGDFILRIREISTYQQFLDYLDTLPPEDRRRVACRLHRRRVPSWASFQRQDTTLNSTPVTATGGDARHRRRPTLAPRPLADCDPRPAGRRPRDYGRPRAVRSRPSAGTAPSPHGSSPSRPPPTTPSWTPSPSPATARASMSRCWRARRWRRGGWAGAPALLVLVGLALMGVNEVFKDVVDRPRPLEPVTGGGESFPSGHTLHAMLTSGLAWLLVMPRLANLTHRRLLLAAILVWPVLVGISRVHLERHWPSDVLGAYVFGAALLIVMAWVWPKVAPVRPRIEYGASSGPVDTVRPEPTQPVRPEPTQPVRPEPVEGPPSQQEGAQ